jgi:hypothetical protein
MSSVTFDTHRVVKRLTEAGFSPAQAETVTDVLQETRASDLSELATKGDVRALQADLRTVEATLRSEMRSLEANTAAKIADSARMVLQWVVGLFVAQIAVVAGLIKLLAGH